MVTLPPNHRFVITGGPGAGKSMLLHSLAKRGYLTSLEAGRAIIQDQVLIGGKALPWADQGGFADLMLSWELRSWHEASGHSGPCFFDRGLPDIAGYLSLCKLAIPSYLERAIQQFRYAEKVFVAPPWEAIYKQDTERKQSFIEAKNTFDAMIEHYSRYGYQLIELPLSDVESRADFVIRTLAVSC